MILRKLSIKTRLLLIFFIMISFTFIIGLLGFLYLKSVKNSEKQTLANIESIADLIDYSATANTAIYSAIVSNDISTKTKHIQSWETNLIKLTDRLTAITKNKNQFNNIFSPGDIQDMSNMIEIIEQTYTPMMQETIKLVNQGQLEDALLTYENVPLLFHNASGYFYNNSIIKALKQSIANANLKNNNNFYNMKNVVSVLALLVIASFVFAHVASKSISVPLAELDVAVRKIAKGELDITFEKNASNDELTYFSQNLSKSLEQLAKIQQLKSSVVHTQNNKKQIEASARARSDFITRLSHEIRTPMNAIMGMTELILREDISHVTYEHISIIKQSSADLFSIINDILDFFKVEIGMLEVVPADYNLSSLIMDVINITRVRLLETGLRFIVSTDSNLPNALYGDEIRIRQILLNILNNAIKYTEKGSVTLTVMGEVVSDSVVNLTIEISDSGKGIMQEDIKKIFEGYNHVGLSASQGTEGTGLGLTISNNLVEAMGGKISVVSEFGVGSTFTVVLPQKIRSSEPLAAVKNPERKKILIYEPRTLYANSVALSVDNLGVSYTQIASEIELEEKLSSGDYNFVFIASSLYKNRFSNAKEICEKFEKNVEMVLLAAIGEVMADPRLSVLALPAHSISIANILNGVSGGPAYSDSTACPVSFSAPDATALVVDDVSTNLDVAKGILLLFGIQTKQCKSGEEAIEAISSAKYDIVLMDCMMPGMDGIEATARIRELTSSFNTTNSGIPIIALTASDVPGEKERFLANGFNDFLTKPVELVKLNSVLEKWIPKCLQRSISFSSTLGKTTQKLDGQKNGTIK